MEAGKLDRRIRIERKVVTQHPDFGTEVITWTALATVWADIQDVLPSRAEAQGQGIRIANKPARVRTRYRSDITSDMRIIDLGRSNAQLRIVSGPVELGRRQGLEFMVENFTTSGDAS